MHEERRLVASRRSRALHPRHVRVHNHIVAHHRHVFVLQDVTVIHVHARILDSLCMFEHAGRFGNMANRTITQSAGVPLQFDELDRIVVLSAGSDGMRAIVTALAEYPAMALRLAIQRQAGVVTRPVASGVAALGLIQPRVWILGHGGDRAVTVGAVRGKILGHCVAQALRVRARMAVIAALGIWRDIGRIYRVVVTVHGV